MCIRDRVESSPIRTTFGSWVLQRVVGHGSSVQHPQTEVPVLVTERLKIGLVALAPFRIELVHRLFGREVPSDVFEEEQLLTSSPEIDWSDGRIVDNAHLEPRSDVVHVVMAGDEVACGKKAGELMAVASRQPITFAPLLDRRDADTDEPGYVAPGEAFLGEFVEQLEGVLRLALLGQYRPLLPVEALMSFSDIDAKRLNLMTEVVGILG